MTAASSELDKVGATFLQLQLKVLNDAGDIDLLNMGKGQGYEASMITYLGSANFSDTDRRIFYLFYSYKTWYWGWNRFLDRTAIL